jgi:hypothetical protein
VFRVFTRRAAGINIWGWERRKQDPAEEGSDMRCQLIAAVSPAQGALEQKWPAKSSCTGLK